MTYVKKPKNVSISSPSSEGGGKQMLQGRTPSDYKFPLVLLQAKVVGKFLEYEESGYNRFHQFSFKRRWWVSNCIVGKTFLPSRFHQFSFKRRWWGMKRSLPSPPLGTFPLVLLQAKVVGKPLAPLGAFRFKSFHQFSFKRRWWGVSLFLINIVKLSKLIFRIINPFIEPARLQNRT